MGTLPKDSAGFVFEGTVQHTESANLAAITDRKRTVVVRVDSVVRASELLQGHEGQDVTVKLAEDERVNEGQRARFYTNGWMFGENVAVESVGHEELASAGARAEGAEVHHEILRQAAEAPIVVRGRVVAVGDAGASAGRRPVTEHDPFWNEAVVEVHEVHKGEMQERIVLRFPASDDVRWLEAPRFEVGHEGVFLLHPDESSGAPALGEIAGAFGTLEPFTCLRSSGFLSAEREAEIAAVLEAVATE